FGILVILSTHIIIIKYMNNIMQIIKRMIFFMTPIFWSLTEANEILQTMASLNPFAYLLMNYRNAMVFDAAPLYGGMSDHLYFWTLTVILIYIGVHIHYRFKNKLVDYL